MDTQSILTAARALIDTPDKWSCDGWGRGGKMCAAHAIYRACGQAYGKYHDAAYEALARVIWGVPNRMIGPWNDTHTHAEVMSAFDRAIAAR